MTGVPNVSNRASCSPKPRVEAVMCDMAFWTLRRLDQNHSLQVWLVPFSIRYRLMAEVALPGSKLSWPNHPNLNLSRAIMDMPSCEHSNRIWMTLRVSTALLRHRSMLRGKVQVNLIWAHLWMDAVYVIFYPSPSKVSQNRALKS